MRSQFAEEDLDRSLADQNIKRLQELLSGCTNDDEREVLLGLLAGGRGQVKATPDRTVSSAVKGCECKDSLYWPLQRKSKNGPRGSDL